MKLTCPLMSFLFNNKRALRKPIEHPTNSKKRKRHIQDEETDVLNRAVKVMETACASPSNSIQVPNEDDLFCQYIATELKAITNQFLKKSIKHKIQNVVFESQFPAASCSNWLSSNMPAYSFAAQSQHGMDFHQRHSSPYMERLGSANIFKETILQGCEPPDNDSSTGLDSENCVSYRKL